MDQLELGMEDRQALQRLVEDAATANELLQNPLVLRFFKDQADSIFNDFCGLEIGCSKDEYQAVHMRLHSLNGLRLMLENTRKRGEQEEQRLGQLTNQDDEF